MHKLDEITYQGGIAGGKVVEGGTFTGLFKAEMESDPRIEQTRGRWAGIPVDNPNIIGRNLASFSVAKLLGADVITPTYKAKHQRKGDDNEVAGIIMEKIEGVRGVDLGHRPRTDLGTHRFFRDPAVRRGLSNLYLLDLICGQVDRHPGNYIIQVDTTGKVIGVKGIDNDLAFGSTYKDLTMGLGDMWAQQKGKLGPTGQASPGMMGRAFAFNGVAQDELSEIDKGMAQRIVDLAGKEADFRLAISSWIKEAEVEAAVGRLKALAHFLSPLLETNDPVIVTEWK